MESGRQMPGVASDDEATFFSKAGILDGEPVGGRQRLGELNVLSLGSGTDLFFVQLDVSPAEHAAKNIDPSATATTPRRVRPAVAQVRNALLPRRLAEVLRLAAVLRLLMAISLVDVTTS